MKKLGKDLKRALAALAHQDAGDYLSMNAKMDILGYDRETENKSLVSPRLVSNRIVKKRIALISNGHGLGAPLDYLIDTCKRQNTDVDLLLHGEFDNARISTLESHLFEAGIQSVRIKLGSNAINKIIKYISRQPSLVFIVGMPDDTVARMLMEEIIPSAEHRITIPLVLIDAKTPEVQAA
jgi:hypothetical protein